MYYGAVRGTDNKWLDIAGWLRSLVPGQQLGAVRYFTARIKDRPGDQARTRQNVYLRALEADPIIEVVYGHFRSDHKWKPLAERPVDELFRPPLVPAHLAERVFAESAAARSTHFQDALVTIEEEKGSDVNLGVHLVRDALTAACDTAVVVTNDSDLEQAMRIAAEHVRILLVNPSRSPTNARLLRHADEVMHIDQSALGRFLLPTTVRARNGRELHCPREWRQKPKDPPEAGPSGPSDDADG